MTFFQRIPMFEGSGELDTSVGEVITLPEGTRLQLCAALKQVYDDTPQTITIVVADCEWVPVPGETSNGGIVFGKSHKGIVIRTETVMNPKKQAILSLAASLGCDWARDTIKKYQEG